jgi:predicted enzyme related to lactoylglutathione lyase
MIKALTHTGILIQDYDEALQWYTQTLGLELRNNSEYGSCHRWVTVGVPGQTGLEIVLHQSPVKEDHSLVGKSPGFIFSTDDCWAEVERLRANGVKVTGEPVTAPWGVQAIFEDLYGNSHVLVEPPASQS